MRDFQAKPFRRSPVAGKQQSSRPVSRTFRHSVGTWLIEPEGAGFFFAGSGRQSANIYSFRGRFVLLSFWTAAPVLRRAVAAATPIYAALALSGLQVVAINVDDPLDISRGNLRGQGRALHFRSSRDTGRRRHLQHRLSLSVRPSPRSPAPDIIPHRRDRKDREGVQGLVGRTPVRTWQSIPRNDRGALGKALPFAGILHQDISTQRVHLRGRILSARISRPGCPIVQASHRRQSRGSRLITTWERCICAGTISRRRADISKGR